MLNHEQKRQRLAALSEDDFRDQVVRPLFQLQGFRAYRDLCGIDEEGKDCIMIREAEFGLFQVYAFQTKKGKLNMSRHATENVTVAITQLRTTLDTTIPITALFRDKKPDFVYLCTSGPANTAARKHITNDLKDTRIRILDSEDIIEAIDNYYPSYWINVHHEKRRYLDVFLSRLLSLSDAIFIHPNAKDSSALQPFSREAYVPQNLYRMAPNLNVQRGVIQTEAKFEEIADEKLLRSGTVLSIITGEGGSGKTTLLRRLALTVCENSISAHNNEECVLPVLVKAIDLVNTESVESLILKTMSTVMGEQSDALFQCEAEVGRIVLLVDALDEVAEDEPIARVVEQLSSFHNAHPTCRIICTSRPILAVRESAAKFSVPVFRISEFSLKQASNIVKRAVANQLDDYAAATEVLRRLQDVHGMKLNPLLVTVFAATPNFQTKDIPPNITAIFKKFAALMLGQWDQQKGLHQSFEWDLKHRLLQAIALQLHLSRETDYSLMEFQEKLDNILESIGFGERGKVISEEILRSGLLAFDSGRVSFRHHLLQEYFAGCEIESVADIGTSVTDDWWRNAIVFSYGNRPNRGDELLVLLADLNETLGWDKYNGLLATGLALQACYMTNVETRRMVFSQVLSSLAVLFSSELSAESEAAEFPLNHFFYFLIEARTAVACDIAGGADLPLLSEESSDYMTYFRLAGAMECGHILKVKDEILKFEPDDKRLVLGLFFMASFIVHLRVSTPAEVTAAKRVMSHCKQLVPELLEEVLKEFQGMVLEVQKGRLEVLDDPSRGVSQASDSQPALPEK